MALVNPNIALSFKPTTEYQPRNALAEYAQVQQIVGGQRQGEVADMQLEALRRDRDALGQIQAAIVAKGGPPDLAAAADAMIKSGKPEYLTQGMAIRQKLADQQAFAAYQSEFDPKAPSAAPAPVNALSANAPSMGATQPAPVNAMAPTAPANAMAATPVNAMVGQPDVASLEARYRRVANIDTPGAKAEAALLLKQIDRAATATPADIKTMQALGYPITQAGFKEYRDAQRPDRLLTPEEEAQKIRIGKQTRPVTTVQLPPQEKAEQAERGKMLTSEYSDISKAAKLAAKTLPSIDANLTTLNSGFKTGFGTETIAAGAKVLAALGVPEAEKFATNAQTFLGSATQAILQKQLEQKGPQTESDAQRIQQTGAQLGNTPQANQFMLATAKAQLKRDMDQRNFYDSWWKNNKTYDGAESAWYAGEGGKSLFDRPELKTYAAPNLAAQIPGQSAPRAVTPPRAPAPSVNIDALLNKYK